MNTITNCPVCGSDKIFPFLKINQVPVHCHVSSKTQTAARMANKNDIHLALCTRCSHIFNINFNPDLVDYTDIYENSLHFSSTFQDYAIWQADQLINRYGLHNKEIIEIGSGHGEFIQLLCERGVNHGTGFDPSIRLQPDTIISSNHVDFIPDYFNDKYYELPIDLICTRHTLEHVPDPNGFIQNIYNAIHGKPGAVVFIEVPNASFIFEQYSIWDIIYEHFSYFSRSSLSFLLEKNGFSVRYINEPYNGQFLTIEATLSSNPRYQEGLDQATAKISTDITQSFASMFNEKISSSRSLINKLISSGSRPVVWGAGSKTVSYLNLVALPSQIEYVVDINPRKVGLFIAGSGQEIVHPGFLRKYCPDHVLVMNSIYKNEIIQTVEELGLQVEYSYP